MSSKRKKKPEFDQIACCFQGGGALGAYQVGVLKALDEAGYAPDWFVGTSIGAINAAIAAGNPPKIRIEKMCAFWERIATPNWIDKNFFPDNQDSRKLQNFLSAQTTLFFGQTGFFTPRYPPVMPGCKNPATKLSYYDTSALKTTLEEFIDFDRINSKKTRLSIGAVEISCGEMVYFDSQNELITPEHIMASGALPPGFPAIEINNHFYWDGGLSSNSPATYVLSTQNGPDKLLCFAIHLFDSYGLLPNTMDEVMMRKKDITFSSRFSKMLWLYKKIHELKNSIHVLAQAVPESMKHLPDIECSIKRGCESTISLVRFLYEQDTSELESKDYEFSEKSICERMHHGYVDGRRAVKKSPWLAPVLPTTGLSLHDMSPNQHLEDSKNE